MKRAQVGIGGEKEMQDAQNKTTHQPKAERNQLGDCPKCHIGRSNDDNFCQYCGKQLKEALVIRDYKS